MPLGEPDGPGRDTAATGAPERSRPLHRRLKFLITPRWIVLIISVICFVLACYLFLAPWQFHRSAEQDAQNAQLAAAEKADPVSISQLMSTDAPPPDDVIWRRVTVTGTFDPSGEAYIRLRHDNDGRAASEVVVPFVAEDGTRVLVDRGYVPVTSVQAGDPLPALPGGTVTVTGRVQADQVDPKHRPPSTAPDGRSEYTAVSSAIMAADGTDPDAVYRGYLQLTGTSPGVIDAIDMPQRDSGPFFSYAIQWLLFGAIAVIGIGYFIYKELSDPVEDDIYLETGAASSGATGSAAQYDAAPDASPQRPENTATPDRAETATARSRAPTRNRGRRKPKFDKSQLYDEA